jgi:aldoxime dehydratase
MVVLNGRDDAARRELEMNGNHELDSAIAPHLRVPRSNTARLRSMGYRPDFDSFTSRLASSVEQVTIAYFGAQSVDGDNPAALASIQDLGRSMTLANGPIHSDRALWVDDWGFTNRFIVAYWTDGYAFDEWFAVDGAAWTAETHFMDGVGFFTEVVRPTVDRLETIFTSNAHPEGLANLAESMSEPFIEAGYWGSMRDRLPITQTDPVAGAGTPSGTSSGARVVIAPQHNLALIRSGQDFSETAGPERAFFLEEIEPTLRAGMDFLRDEGRSFGCYANRYMDVVDENEEFVEKRFAVSLWSDLSGLELWAKSHPTHSKIFASAMRHMAEFGSTAELHLYHEVMVVERQHQWFEYLNCHDKTGLLGVDAT